MSEEIKRQLVDIIRRCGELSAEVRECADQVSSVREYQFDQSYLDFLDEQIQLAARGPEWNEVLRKRWAGLEPYCDVPLINGTIRIGTDDYTIKADPATGDVVYWERFER